MSSRWEPGQSGNPAGRPKDISISQETRDARKLTRAEFESVAHDMVGKTAEELKDIIEDPKVPYFKKCVASILVHAAAKGDHNRLEFILKYLGVKAPEEVSIVNRKEEVYVRPGTLNSKAGPSQG